MYYESVNFENNIINIEFNLKLYNNVEITKQKLNKLNRVIKKYFNAKFESDVFVNLFITSEYIIINLAIDKLDNLDENLDTSKKNIEKYINNLDFLEDLPISKRSVKWIF